MQGVVRGTALGMMRRVAGLAAMAMVVGHIAASAPRAAAADGASPATGGSGLPLPRFVSLKSDRVNLRSGPSTDYPTAWVFRRAGMPVEVVKEFETWRQVRDAEGATGWVLSSMLSGRRTAVVLPWEIKPGAPVPELPLRADNSASAPPVVMIEAGVIASVRNCDRQWCEVVVGDYKGYIEQSKLWGVYPDEAIR